MTDTNMDGKRDRIFARIEDRRNKRLNEKHSADDAHKFHLDDFNKLFSERRSAISSAIESLSSNSIDSVNHEFNELRSFLSEWAPFLPDRDAGRAQGEVQQLQNKLNHMQDQIKPKKRFAFSSKKKQTEPSDQSNISPFGDHRTPKPAVHNIPQEIKIQAECTVENVCDRCVTVAKEECHNKDVLLKDISDSTIKLVGNGTTVHLIGIRSSKIVLAPVLTSVFMDKCTDCTIVVACQQLRMHNSSKCNVYLHVTSAAIIEDSNNISVAPYNLNDAQNIIKEAGLNCLTNNWDKVQDFNWLSSEHSPNWQIIPVQQRIQQHLFD